MEGMYSEINSQSSWLARVTEMLPLRTKPGIGASLAAPQLYCHAGTVSPIRESFRSTF